MDILTTDFKTYVINVTVFVIKTAGLVQDNRSVEPKIKMKNSTSTGLNTY